MNITTQIKNIGFGLDEHDKLAVLNFTIVATSDTDLTDHLDISKIGGEYPAPAIPRTPIKEPIMEPVMEPIMEAVYESQIGDDGEPHQVQVGERQIGEQQVGERQVGEKVVGYEGGYTDEEVAAFAEQLAQERNAYVTLQLRLENMAIVPLEYVPPPVHVPTDADRKKDWADQIDSYVAFVYGRYTRFQLEYELREAAAQAYKNAGYSGQADDMIVRFATNTGLSSQAATDLILSQSANLRGAVRALGNLRMDKYKVIGAATLELAESQFDVTMSAIKTVDESLT